MCVGRIRVAISHLASLLTHGCVDAQPKPAPSVGELLLMGKFVPQREASAPLGWNHRGRSRLGDNGFSPASMPMVAPHGCNSHADARHGYCGDVSGLHSPPGIDGPSAIAESN